jgi:hypothetical protein
VDSGDDVIAEWSLLLRGVGELAWSLEMLLRTGVWR